MNTTYRKNLKDVAIACKNYVDTMFNNFRWELGAYDIDLSTDSNVAYVKSVPSTAIGCEINTLGGMSYKSENLAILHNVSGSIFGIDYSASNGVISVSGTSSSAGNVDFEFDELSSDTYSILIQIVSGTQSTSSKPSIYVRNASNSYVDYSDNNRRKFSFTNSFKYIRVGWSETSLSLNLSFKIMVIKGSTLPTEFKESFTGIRDSAVTSVVSKDSNDTTVATFPISSQIQNLTGYGWGIDDTCYNYIDFDRKVFVQKDGKYTFTGNETISFLNQGAYPNIFYFELPSPSVAVTSNSLTDANYSLYTDFNTMLTNDVNSYICGSSSGTRLLFKLVGITTTSGALSELTGKTFHYELATPVETDISSYITDDDKYIDVVPSGTIIFDNTYENDVPSDITYLIEVAK